MSTPDPKIVRSAFFEIIENQMRDGTPPATKQTYDRLIAEGYPHDDTMKMISCALTAEIFGILKESNPYDERRYIAALNALPALPFAEE